MAHDITTSSGNSLPERMTRQEQAFSQLMKRLGDLPAGYVLMSDLRELKAISAVLREHMRTVDATLDSLRQDFAITTEKSIPPRDGLLYVQAKVNGIEVLAMVDTGATHSFVTGRDVRRLKLELKEHGYRIKAVNSEAQPVLGVASVELTFGPWSGKCSLMAVPLDDFDLILGKEFMGTNKIFLIPHLDGIMIADERCPTFIPFVFVNANTIAGPLSKNDRDKRGGQISAIQLENGLKRGEITYLAALVEIKPDVFQEVPDCCAVVLDEFVDIMPAELPKMWSEKRLKGGRGCSCKSKKDWIGAMEGKGERKECMERTVRTGKWQQCGGKRERIGGKEGESIVMVMGEIF
ncbi:hypothetical protein ACH5RR_003472 [Cinchona calisaya]|uniref:Uncharacterized protein n=1 Tax=Cinchona calisaya TaxID=153742 RepID=A0ABD3AV92_9GENT